MTTPALDLKRLAPGACLSQPGLCVILRRESGARILTQEWVTPEDLTGAAAEFWRERFLRRGRTDVALDDLDIRVTPIPSETHPSRCDGYYLCADIGQEAGEFTIYSLDATAVRAAKRLQESGVLKSGETYTYEVISGSTPSPRINAGVDLSFDVAVKKQALSCLQVPLRPCLEKATPENSVDEEAFPVFYTAAARARAEQCARQGAATNPRAESGALLVGTLCSCPLSGEFFSVVTDIFEVFDAAQTVFSLTYSGSSWVRLQTILKARQTVQPAVRMLGQCHGHNFLPNDGKTCEPCPRRPECNLTNVFASADDQVWTRAVFARQPWQLCHIFGLTARGDKINGLYSLRDGRLHQRGFYVLPHFEPSEWPPCGAATAAKSAH